MTRRISLPGADELFRKTTLSAVPDQVVEEVEVAHTNRPTTTSVAKAAPKGNGVRQTSRRRPTGLDKVHLVAKSMTRKLRCIYRRKNYLI